MNIYSMLYYIYTHANQFIWLNSQLIQRGVHMAE